MLLGIFVRAFHIHEAPYSRRNYTDLYGGGIATYIGRRVNQY